MATRLQEKYTSEVCKGLMEKFNYKNVNELPKLEKDCHQHWLRRCCHQQQSHDSAVEDLTVISGQKPIHHESQSKIQSAAFNLQVKASCPIGCQRLRSAAAACMNSLINS